MSAATALVTGANGFVGAWLCRALRERGHRVVGLGIEPPRDDLPLDDWEHADIADDRALSDAVARVKPAWVVHLAGQSSAAKSFEAPQETFRVNVRGTWNLLEAVREGAPGARVLVVGSGEIYGPMPEGERAKEDAPVRPVSPYALSKAAADALAEAHGRVRGVDVIRTRSFSHTGPGQTARFVIPAFAQQIASIEAGGGEPVLRVGNLEVTRDLSDVRDVAEAYALLLERGRSGAAYNVCRGEGVRLADIAAWLAKHARVPVEVKVDPARLRPADVPWLVGDPSTIARDVGWRAAIPLEQTLAEVLDDCRARVGV